MSNPQTEAAMTLFQIKCRFSGAVRFEGQFGSILLCVEAAVKAGANLTGAYLAGANLARAYLARTDLAGANLARANLTGADLTGANLTGAYLAGANLAGANLTGAYLAGANLAGAYLARANLTGAYLAGATIRDAKLGSRGLVKEASRSDGYRFQMFDCADGAFRVMAGCRWFTLEEAWRHWTATRDGTPLGEETFDILVMFEHHAERLRATP
jgi:hypothetical protein